MCILLVGRAGRKSMNKRPTNSRLTPELLAELARVAAMPDEDIDLTEMPELLDWSKGERGKFYRLYFTRRGHQLILLLCGGDKDSQSRDIAKAIAMAAKLEDGE